ncbi:hypothetical protein AMTRI_Chr07g25920 [Amborella trichopoda]
MAGTSDREIGPSRGGRVEGGTTLGDPSGEGCSRSLGGEEGGGVDFRAEHEASFERTRASAEGTDGSKKLATVSSFEQRTHGGRGSCHVVKVAVFVVLAVPTFEAISSKREGPATKAQSKSPPEDDGSKKEPDDP